jgi:hypothetical protein
LLFFYAHRTIGAAHTIWLALLVISGFGNVRKKRHTEVTCKLQVIYERRKENNKDQGWERIFRKGVVTHFCQIGKDKTDENSGPRT